MHVRALLEVLLSHMSINHINNLWENLDELQNDEDDRDGSYTNGFYRLLRERHPRYTKTFKQYANWNRKMASLQATRIFLLRCRTFKTWPKHIVDSTKVFERLLRSTKACSREIHDSAKTARRNLLNLDIKICLAELNFAEMNMKRIEHYLRRNFS